MRENKNYYDVLDDDCDKVDDCVNGYQTNDDDGGFDNDNFNNYDSELYDDHFDIHSDDDKNVRVDYN